MFSTVKKITRKNAAFLVPYIIACLIAVYFLSAFSKIQLHILINRYHNNFFDFFFKYMTDLGTGLFAVTIGIAMLFISFRKGVFLFAGIIVSGIVVHFLKLVVFPGLMRPVKLMEGIYALHLAEGVKMLRYHSFPSGHSATAFALFFSLALISERNIVKFVFFLLALCVACSRVYLSEHFVIDILFGSIIGVITAIALYKPVYLSGNKQLDNNLLHALKHRKNVQK